MSIVILDDDAIVVVDRSYGNPCIGDLSINRLESGSGGLYGDIWFDSKGKEIADCGTRKRNGDEKLFSISLWARLIALVVFLTAVWSISMSTKPK